MNLNPKYAELRHSYFIFTESITEYFPVAAAAEVGVVLDRILDLDLDMGDVPYGTTFHYKTYEEYRSSAAALPAEWDVAR